MKPFPISELFSATLESDNFEGHDSSATLSWLSFDDEAMPVTLNSGSSSPAASSTTMEPEGSPSGFCMAHNCSEVAERLRFCSIYITNIYESLQVLNNAKPFAVINAYDPFVQDVLIKMLEISAAYNNIQAIATSAELMQEVEALEERVASVSTSLMLQLQLCGLPSAEEVAYSPIEYGERLQEVDGSGSHLTMINSGFWQEQRDSMGATPLYDPTFLFPYAETTNIYQGTSSNEDDFLLHEAKVNIGNFK